MVFFLPLFGFVREKKKVGHRESDTWKGILQAIGGLGREKKVLGSLGEKKVCKQGR